MTDHTDQRFLEHDHERLTEEVARLRDALGSLADVVTKAVNAPDFMTTPYYGRLLKTEAAIAKRVLGQG